MRWTVIGVELKRMAKGLFAADPLIQPQHLPGFSVIRIELDRFLQRADRLGGSSEFRQSQTKLQITPRISGRSLHRAGEEVRRTRKIASLAHGCAFLSPSRAFSIRRGSFHRIPR